MQHRVVLLDVDDRTRRARLEHRNQPELATPELTQWAAYVAENARALGGVVIDGSASSTAVAEAICRVGLELIATDRD
jgi:hypothetical protein